MSSHHFVKEGQEPPLLILDVVPFEPVADLLEWAPLVITTSKALEAILSWGIKIDIVLVANGEDNVAEKLHEQQPVEIIFVPEHDWLKTSLRIAEELHSTSVHVVAASADNVVRQSDDQMLERLVLFDGRARWIGVTSAFEKWVPEKQRFSVLPSAARTEIVTVGVTHANGDFVADHEGLVRFHSPKPFWLGELMIT